MIPPERPLQRGRREASENNAASGAVFVARVNRRSLRAIGNAYQIAAKRGAAGWPRVKFIAMGDTTCV